jgi:phosphosulfolactate synthase (CoM biosynthesis protein A)
MGSNKDSLPPIQAQDQDQGQKARDKEAREELKELQLLQKKDREREEEISQLRNSLLSAQIALHHVQQEQDQALLSQQGIERQKRDEEQRNKCREVERAVEAELERGREYREYLGVLKGLLGSKASCIT